jgi:rubrerythrin
MKGKRVLAVDCDWRMRRLIRANLEAAGLTVEEAVDGHHGLQLARGRRPDLILLDLDRPGMDARQFLDALHGPENHSNEGETAMKAMTKENLEDGPGRREPGQYEVPGLCPQAAREGKPNIARLFEAISYAEQVHAINHLKELGGRHTVANLQAAIDGENFEVDEMYAAYLEVAEAQGEKGAKRSMTYAMEAEKIHADYVRRGQGRGGGRPRPGGSARSISARCAVYPHRRAAGALPGVQRQAAPSKIRSQGALPVFGAAGEPPPGSRNRCSR